MGEWKKVEDLVEQPGQPEQEEVSLPQEETAVRPGIELPAEPEIAPTDEAEAAPETESAEAALAVPETKETGLQWTKAENTEPEDNERAETVIRGTGRYTKRGRRRGRHRFAAPLGLLVLLLAATGVVALVIFGVQAIQRSQDDTALREELMDFLNPVTQYIPDPFTDINDDPQDALMLAAIWKLTDAERIRQIREKDDNSIYQIDDDGFMQIPLQAITDSYASLYGEDAVPQLKSIGEPDTIMYYEYDASAKIYRVPFSASNSAYTPVLDTLKKKGDQYTLRIGYVSAENIGIDEKGNLVDPTPDQADFLQIFHVQKAGDGWKLTGVEDTSR